MDVTLPAPSSPPNVDGVKKYEIELQEKFFAFDINLKVFTYDDKIHFADYLESLNNLFIIIEYLWNWSCKC